MSSPIPPSILVIGAGELGNSVLEALASHPKRSNSKLAVLLRESTINTQDAAKKQANEHLRSLGAVFEPADIASASIPDLAQVFARYHTIISCSGFGLPPGTQLKLTKAILQAKTPRYFPWQWGVDYDVVGQGSAQDLFDEQLQVRALLRAQDATDWVIVSTGLFMSFLFLPAFGAVDLENRTVRALGGWGKRLTVTTARDIGRVAADLAWVPEGVSRQVAFVAGDTVSYERVAELVERRFGVEWKREVWDGEFLKGKLEEKPDDTMLKYVNVWAVGKGVAWDMDETVNAKRGIEMQGLESYLREMPDLK